MISIIIPTYNEENNILDLLNFLQDFTKGQAEILVVDGGSSDQTVSLVKKKGIHCLMSPKKGRAAQMNAGARYANGDVLYFVHADTIPPASFPVDINEALSNGYKAGCYCYQFDSSHRLLKINAYCTRFNRLFCRGGDQTLFVTRSLFEELGGFREDYLIMEDYDLIKKIQANSSFCIIPKNATVSARKYEYNGYFRVNIANLIVFTMYLMGISQQTLMYLYKNLILHPKFE